MKDLIIVGASGFGREVLHLCKEVNKKEKKWHIKGFLDDNLRALDGYSCEYTVVGTIKDWKPNDNEEFVVALAFPKTRKFIIESLLQRKANIVSVIHPDADIWENSHIGKGCIMFPHAGLTVNAVVGDYVIILGQSYVAHDVRVGSFSTICAQCGLNGGVIVGEGVFIGNNVSVAPGKRIGNYVNVGAGSVVVKDIKDNVSVFGSPAVKI